MVLSDAEAAMGCWRLADDERIDVDAAFGIDVAVYYDGGLQRSFLGLIAGMWLGGGGRVGKEG